MKRLCVKCTNFALPGSNYCKKHQMTKRKTQTEKSYRELKRKVYGTTKWEKLREKALLRDLYTCQLCGAQADEVHHVISLRENSSKAFDLNNLLSVCHDCHFAIHTNKKDIW